MVEPSARVWLQLEFEWVPYGFLPAVTEAYADTFEQALVELGFAVASVDATSRTSMVQGLRRAFDLPDWCNSPNWDSLLDCLDEVTWPPRQAVVLRHADAGAREAN